MKKGITLAVLSIIFAASLPISALATSSNENKLKTISESASVVQGNDEHQIVYNEPPKDFNPIQATDEELKKYGYPTRPTDKDDYEIWKKNVNGTWKIPVFDKEKSNSWKSHGLEVNKVTNNNISFSTSYSANQGGAISADSVKARVTGFWSQPDVSATSSTNRPAYAGEWIGLGGTNSEPLIQTGTASHALSTSSYDYRVWYEIAGTNLNNAPVYLSDTAFPHSAGDTYYADVSFYKGSPGYATFYISDSTQNTTTSFTVSNINYTSD